MRTLSSFALASALALLAGCTSPAAETALPADAPADPARDSATALLVRPAEPSLQGSFDAEAIADACDAFDTLRVEGHVFVEALDGDLPDLTCLTVVTGDLVIEGNPGLRSLDGLVELRTIGGDLVVRDNPELEDLLGLGRVLRAASVTIEGNDALVDLEGLDKLTDADQLVVADNASLQTLEGMLALGAAFSGDLLVLDNPSLVSVSGLDALTNLGGTLEISGNRALTDLDGLDALRTVADTLRVHDNATLTDVLALHGVQYVGGDLLVTENPALAAKAVDSLSAAILEVEGSVILEGNGA